MIVDSPYAAGLRRTPVRRRTATIGGAKTRWWDYGDPDALRTMVLVHGFRGDHHGLEPVVAQLDGVRILAPDLPGFGASGPLPGTHDIDGYAAWLREFVAHQQLTEPPVVLGHSFGSIVVAAAVAGGLEASAVVLVNPIAAPALEGPRAVLTKAAIAYYRLAALLPERMGFALLRNRAIVRVMSMSMAKTGDRGLRRFIHGQHDRYFSVFHDRRMLLEAFRASVGSNVSDYAAEVRVPVLLVAAERDDITPLEAQHRLAELLPDSRLRVIDGVGHLIHYETPGAAAGYIRAFLSGLEARVARGDAA
ncbi:alpha/beta hydrolase [Agromyces rhizosphaerae]|uniref:Alpha/beta hydrolase n=1 Tax=Agromyces rhizosphaerae TaxID=88374 RepID=A0A9W6CZ21_9MICO|nr:alpha/beta hydrolase [Agromyces rhizosphaerae]GLI28900.1 alpha/beta hydrolase [Agromyces rhizosphaerae]